MVLNNSNVYSCYKVIAFDNDFTVPDSNSCFRFSGSIVHIMTIKKEINTSCNCSAFLFGAFVLSMYFDAKLLL